MQGQRHAFFQSQGIADDGGGKFDHPLVPQVHQSIHDAGNQSLRLVGKDRVRPIRRGHKRHKELRKGFGAAERERVVRVGKAARSFSFDFAGSAVVQHAKIIVTSQKTGHLPISVRRVWDSLSGRCRTTRFRGQRVVGKGNQRFRLAGTCRAEEQAMGENILGFQPKLLFVLKPVAEKEDAFRSGKTAPSGQGIAPVRTGQAHRHTERQAFARSRRRSGEQRAPVRGRTAAWRRPEKEGDTAPPRRCPRSAPGRA